jgi:transcriptional regulator with XRE-family HTH domain
MDFYGRVKGLAKKQGRTVQELVLSLGISLDSYYTMKKAGNLPRADEAVALARALGVSAEYLVDGEAGGNAGPAGRIRDLALQIAREAGRIK